METDRIRILQRRISLFGLMFAFLGGVAGPLPAQEPAGGESSLAGEPLSQIVRAIVLESLAETYIDEKKWGQTEDRFDGFHVRGLRISKRKREVNHGFWRRYEVSLTKPEETLKLQVQQEPAPRPGVIPFSIACRFRAKVKATFALWTYGVKGLNGTTVSHATLQLRILLETSPHLEFSIESPLPRLELRPRIADVQIRLLDLEVDRIGVIEGDLAKVIGDGSESAVDSLIQQQSRKIRQKLQRKLED